MQSVDYSAFIRQAFNGDKGLAGAITKLPLEKKFRLQTVKEVRVCRQRLHAADIGAVSATPSCSLRLIGCAKKFTILCAAVNGCM